MTDNGVRERQRDHDKLYWQAFELLQQEFISAMAHGGATMVPTPHHGEHEETMLSLLVQRQMDGELTNYTLNHLIDCVVRAASNGDSDAMHLMERMARTHAAYYTSLMQDAGDFQS